MNTMSGYENASVSQPHTEAGQMLQALGQSGGSMVVAEDGPSRLQTYMYFDDEGAAQPFVEPELYDYVLDGVVFKDEVVNVSVSDTTSETAALPAKTYLKQFAGGNVLEAGMIDQGDGRSKYSVSLTMPKPSETYQQIREATGVAGVALWAETKETSEELWAETKEALKRRDMEAEGAVSVICGQVIFEHLEWLGNPSIVNLIGSIQEKHPDLPKEPQFRAIITRLRERMKDGPVAAQEAYKQKFANIDREQLAEQLEPVPAFHKFCEQYNIDPNKVLEG